MLFVSFIFGVFVGWLFCQAWQEIKSIEIKKLSKKDTDLIVRKLKLFED